MADSAPAKIQVRYTIEPTWEATSFSGAIEIDPGDLEGLEGEARDKAIEAIVGERVAGETPWGWTEMSPR
jgi:hypothetical protein